MNTCEDCGLKHQAFMLECPHCQTELTHYTEPGSLSFEVSVEKGQLIMRVNAVDMYDEMEGSFFCVDCKDYVEAHEVRDKLEQLDIVWADVKEIVTVPVT